MGIQREEATMASKGTPVKVQNTGTGRKGTMTAYGTGAMVTLGPKTVFYTASQVAAFLKKI
jgi:hypothetical protein